MVKPTKLCRECGETKPRDEFHRNGSKSTDARRPDCATCENRKSRQARAEDRPSAVRRRERKREQYASSEDVRARVSVRNKMYRYGVTPERLAESWKSQGALCAICREESVPYQDHDHGCCSAVPYCGNCNRGLLCRRCNLVLGQVGDSAELLDAMKSYLASWGSIS